MSLVGNIGRERLKKIKQGIPFEFRAVSIVHKHPPQYPNDTGT
jgi:hypothetical protein